MRESRASPTTLASPAARRLRRGRGEVPNDTAAFIAKYGAGALIAGQAPGALNNGGERIVLRDADGNVIHDFTYLDTAPWPTTPDGGGPSLEVIDTNGNYDSGLNWRASWEIGGSPGWQGAGPDTDGDGQPDSWEALFGTDPNSIASRFRRDWPLLLPMVRNTDGACGL